MLFPEGYYVFRNKWTRYWAQQSLRWTQRCVLKVGVLASPRFPRGLWKRICWWHHAQTWRGMGEMVSIQQVNEALASIWLKRSPELEPQACTSVQCPPRGEGDGPLGCEVRLMQFWTQPSMENWETDVHDIQSPEFRNVQTFQAKAPTSPTELVWTLEIPTYWEAPACSSVSRDQGVLCSGTQKEH